MFLCRCAKHESKGAGAGKAHGVDFVCGDTGSGVGVLPVLWRLRKAGRRSAVGCGGRLVEGEIEAKLTVKTPPVAGPASPAAKEAAAAPSSSSKQPTRPGRPKDVVDWRLDDYHSAKCEGDPRLVAAVDYLGTHFAGKEMPRHCWRHCWSPQAKFRWPRVRRIPNPERADRGMYSVTGGSQSHGGCDCRLGSQLGTPVPGKSSMSFSMGCAGRRTDLRWRLPLSKGLPCDPARKPKTCSSGSSRCRSARRRAEDPAANDLAKFAPRDRTAPHERFRFPLGALARFMLGPETPQGLYEQLWSCVMEPRSENIAGASCSL